MVKSAQAFRTIREVADWLDVAAHVLRFWESKFSQIKPVKRAGGRRYYRPADMELVGGIKVLLHDRGLTIRGVQKMISDEGVEAVCALSPPIDDLLNNPNVVQLDPSKAWEVDADTDIAESDSAAESTPEEADVGPAVGPQPVPEPAPHSAPKSASAKTATTKQTGPLDQTGLFDQTDHAAPPATDGPAPQTPHPPQNTPSTPPPLATVDPASAAPATAQSSITPADPEPEATPEPEPASDPVATSTPNPASRPAPILIPTSDPAEGRLGTLAALAALPEPQRARLAPQIAALAQLRDKMAKDHTAA